MSWVDPEKPEFASWRSYREFARRVRRGRRFVWEKEVQAFLDTVLATLKGRDIPIKTGTELFRAQQGIDRHKYFDENGNILGVDECAFGPERMKPDADRAREGRVNPTGIPVLYLAAHEQTAISEIRPWICSEVSVARFEVVRDLRGVDLSLGHGQHSIGKLKRGNLSGAPLPDAATKQEAVWTDIDCACSEPVTRSDNATDYVPTQILSELFRDAGYDAIVYRSQFGDDGYNVALFDLDAANAVIGAPFKVTAIEVSYEKMGSPWFRSPRRSE